MNENELWEIGAFDSENSVKRTKMALKRGSSKLVLYSLSIPASWSIGDKIGDFKLREDAGPGYISLSNKSKDRANKPKEGPIQARVIDDPDNFMKSLKSAEKMEYPHLDKEQKIIRIEALKIWLGDDCKSRWYFHPTTDPLPKEWVAGDAVIVSQAGSGRRGDKRMAYNVTNIRTKQKAVGFWENPGEKSLESYDTEKGRKGTIDDVILARPTKSNKEFDKFGKELAIEDLDEKVVSVTDNNYSWEFRWYSLIGHHGEWMRGDPVIITKSDKRTSAKVFTIMNVRTGKFLTITPVTEEDEE